MFEKYFATIDDFRTIEIGIDFVWKKELDFIFKNKKLIEKVIIVSYDSENLYLWSKVLISELSIISTNKNGYNFYRIPHKINIKDKYQRGWRVGIWDNKMEEYLPKRLLIGNYNYPKICGSLLKPFIGSHNKKISAYYSKESYLATIIHEFGHVYFDQYKLWWYSNKRENLKYIKTAIDLYSNKNICGDINIKFPSYLRLSELFAFCTDYTASEVFWKKHKEDIDKYNFRFLKKIINIEKNKNLETEDSVFENKNDSGHIFASVIGKILIEKYRENWPQKLLNSCIKI